MDPMAIAGMSTDLSMFKLQQSVQMSVLNKAMSTQETSMAALFNGLEQSVPAPSDHVVDVLA